MLAQLMKPEYLAVLRQTVDGDRGESISPEQYQAVVDAVSDENGRQVVSFVLSKVGYPYSQAYRDSGSYYDCSSLAYYAWQSAGVNLMYEGANTAAAEGKFCYDNNYLVDYEDMQAGDLIFYSYEENGRFYDITHVAIYMEYIDLNSLESRQDVAEVMLELGGTFSNEEAWSEIYNWANKTVSARFCSSTLQLGQFLQGYLNSTDQKVHFDEERCSKECLEKLRVMGMNTKGIINGMDLSYKKLDASFKQGRYFITSITEIIVLHHLRKKAVISVGLSAFILMTVL